MQVVLFGSRARGEARPDSDVDLLVVLDHVGDRRKAAVAIGRLFRDLPVAKDIVVTTPAEIEARGRRAGTGLGPALAEGKILYQRADSPLPVRRERGLG